MFAGSEVVIVLGVLVLLFGSSQIPKLARNLSAARRELRGVVTDGSDDT